MGLLKKKEKSLDEIQKDKVKDFEKKSKGKSSIDLSFDKKRLTVLIIILVIVLLAVAGLKFGKPLIDKILGNDNQVQEIESDLPKILTTATDYKGRWSETYMVEMVKRGILLETGLTTLSPEAPVVRSQYMVALYTLDNKRIPIKEENIIYFTDVLDNFFYTNAINWGSSNGFISGTSPETFKPNYNVRKEQAIFILYMYYSTLYKDTNNYDVLNTEYDDLSISNYAKPAMKWATINNLLTFIDKKDVNFMDPCTREEVAALLYNYIMLIDENASYNCNTVYETALKNQEVEKTEEVVDNEQGEEIVENTDENEEELPLEREEVEE